MTRHFERDTPAPGGREDGTLAYAAAYRFATPGDAGHMVDGLTTLEARSAPFASSTQPAAD